MLKKNTQLIGYVLTAMFIVTGLWQISQGIYIHAKALLAQELLEQAWTQTLEGKQRVTPWSWADTWPVARLQVPRLNVDLVVLAGDSGRTLAFGPGHNFASASPGEMGNAFVSGHRDTHFRFLKYLHNGDYVFVETAQGQRIRYVVNQMSIVNENEAYLPVDEMSARLSLITCYPFDGIAPGPSQRYVVSAVKI